MAPYIWFHAFFLIVSLAFISAVDENLSELFILFFLPVLGLVYAFRMFTRERDLSVRLERFSLQMAASMVTALDLKDNYTARHSAAVAQYAFDIATAMGIPEHECYVAHLAGLLHDLGKIGIPDSILNSHSRLDDSEWRVVKSHSEAGRDILHNISEFGELAEIILYHHERYDGNGYPAQLAGEAIPLMSRIICVADSYSAMISNRPYSRRMTAKEAAEELERQSGLQFDPYIAGVFLGILNSRTEAYRMGRDVDFHVEFQKVRFLRNLVERAPA